MLGEALSVLERAHRLQRRFFTHSVTSWEPPVDLVESAAAVEVHVALPGARPETITVTLEPDAVVVAASRPFPFRETRERMHRIEIPYGRFERRIPLPLANPHMPLELAGQALADGVLTLTFRKKGRE